MIGAVSPSLLTSVGPPLQVSATDAAVRTVERGAAAEGGTAARASDVHSEGRSAQSSRGGSAADTSGKSEAQQRSEEAQLQQLKARDRAVRAHEAAHLGAAGGLARGGASFTFQRGPDGQLYAIGGEVSLDVSKGGTPQETIAKAARIEAAARAPADPSSQDLKVAAQAARMAAQAQQELAAQRAASYGQSSTPAPGSLLSEFA